MSYPTTEEALRRLEADPAAAAAFDQATRREMPQAASRREAVAATLEAIRACIDEHAAKRRLLATQRAKIRALEAVSATLPATRAKLTKAQAAAVRPSGRTVASATPTLDAFNRLTGDAAARFYRAHRLAIITEAEGRKFNF